MHFNNKAVHRALHKDSKTRYIIIISIIILQKYNIKRQTKIGFISKTED